VFILSSAEDLVPELKAREAGWETVESQREGYCVRRYRPRIEGPFARIERWTRVSDGDVHWRSISKDNILTFYGLDSESRICDPENPSHVFSWLICQSYDAVGNAILYEYAPENDHGVDLARANERNRRHAAHRYLRRIRYGNRRPVLLDPELPSFRRSHATRYELENAGWMFEMVLDYGGERYREHSPDDRGQVFVQVEAAQGDFLGPVRADPFSSYRAGFEVRTYRLCRRVLMFHSFPHELGADRYLVRSLEFHYEEKPFGSFLRRAVQSGFRRDSDGRYFKRSLPALEVEYSASPLENTGELDYDVREVEGDSLANLPAGADSASYRWADLDGEGISGILSEQANAWFYKPNVGQGRFGRTEVVSPKPSFSGINEGSVQLMDVAGDGNLDLVDLAPSAAGFYERTFDAGWQAFRPFAHLPVRDWKDPNLRFVDLTGNGIADVLITEDDAILWHPSKLLYGYGDAIRVHAPDDEERGPRIVFADGTQTIFLADMSGDGLSDVVRIRNGEVCYWPNLGYGHFGAKVTMGNSPRLDQADLFDPQRIHLADTDGSGTTDIIYFDSDSVRVFLNQSGNSWSNARVLRGFPASDHLSSISVTDLLGRGTSCLVWSSALAGDATRPMRYVDLMRGIKPHLLIGVVNNLGAETRIEYVSSTEFYLSDKASGHPWVTRLPFPVQVVKRVETLDHVSHNRFVSSYTYHHGYFDGPEREFRGFGRVEQLDTEEFGTLDNDSTCGWSNWGTDSQLPPVLTKRWFHTGAYLDGRAISRHLEHEYHRENALTLEQHEAMQLDDTVLPPDLTPEEEREACRSLKGSMLRQELYALDGCGKTRRPYTVTENNMTIRLLQPREWNRHAVFFTHTRESVALSYERELYEVDGQRRADPRVSHQVTLRADDYGNVLDAVSIGYGRRFPDRSPLLTETDRTKQSQILVMLSTNRYTNMVEEADAYRTPAVVESRVYELIHPKPDAPCSGITNLFRFHELETNVARVSDGHHDLTYEDLRGHGAAKGIPYRRLLRRSRTLYRSNRLTHILPHGRQESLALAGASYKLALTPGLLKKVFERRDHDGQVENLLPDPLSVLAADGGYVNLEGNGQWWVPTGAVYYSPHMSDSPAEELHCARHHFFLPHRFCDPFGNVSMASYDAHDLSLVETCDPRGNTTHAEIDYRVLSPKLVRDPNGNCSAAEFDALGMLVGTAVMGKLGEKQGDSLEGFIPDLDESTIRGHIRRPLEEPYKILGEATARLVYDLFAFERTQQDSQPQPAVIYTLTRETHVSALAAGEQTRIQHAFSFSDGIGREIQKKTQAEPGPLQEGGPRSNARWVGSGWTIFNNKGKPVRQYEPFFSATQEFEFARIVGVSPILIYDPVGRVIATLRPDHTFDKVVFDPWGQQAWDANDTVLRIPADDPDVRTFVKHLPPGNLVPTWYQRREDGQMGAAEQNAGRRAAVHADTPTAAYLDSLGRTILAVAHNRFHRDDDVVNEFLVARSDFDIEGNQLSVTDALGRTAMSYDYDMRNTRLHQNSIDAGERWILNDIRGNPIRKWDSRGHEFRYKYDALRRPFEVLLKTGHGHLKLLERTVYGEEQPNAATLNLRTRVFQQFDGAGVVSNQLYDFKGNLLASTMQLLAHYREPEINWSASPQLETAVYSNSNTYDALNRIVTATTPDASTIQPHYNEAGLLTRVDANVRGSETTTPFVTRIDYDAKRQRTFIHYGNGARTHYTYNPLTFRLVTLKTRRHREGALLQDLNYTYDPVGNVTVIHDAAREKVYFRNQVVSPTNSYIYDAVYRLIMAEGREHIGQLAPASQTDYDDSPRMDQPLPGDGQAMRRYHEHYRYDQVGNILSVMHRAAEGDWTRRYFYSESHLTPASNRLASTHVGELDEHYSYNAHGDTTRMPHLRHMDWDCRDQLHATQRQVVNSCKEEDEHRWEESEGPHRGQRTYYVYSSTGQRVRKIMERSNGDKSHERIYLGGLEIYREYSHHGEVKFERDTLHVMDDKRRIALVETRTVDHKAAPDKLPDTLTRYQFTNHLDSATLELDEAAEIISYEEYYPYGSTSYGSVRKQVEVSPKRYRYTGKERDEETGFYYHGARYCASWLGRWISCDPAGMVDGTNLYAYARNNPISLRDPYGTDTEATQQEEAAQACLVDPTSPQPTALEEQQQASLPSEHPQASVPPTPPPQKEYDGPTIRAETEGEHRDRMNSKILNLDLPPAQLPTDEGDYLGTFGVVYSIAYGVKQSIYKPIKSLVLDEHPQYLDSEGHVRTWEGQVDHTDALAAIGQIAMLALPGAGEANVAREAMVAGDIALEASASKSLLMVGPESTEEFNWLASQGQSGWSTTAVNPLRTPAASTFEAAGGRFVEGEVENVGQAFNWTHESFPQPLGRTMQAVDAYQARLATLAPGGRLSILTENQELIDMYRSLATTPKAPYSFSESLFTPAHPQAGLLPPATSTFVQPGANVWLLDILRHF
jgi:RHS repeat-associated protein